MNRTRLFATCDSLFIQSICTADYSIGVFLRLIQPWIKEKATYVNRPTIMPSVILPLTGMRRMVRKAGSVSTGFVRLMWRTELNRKKPAMTMTGAVAADGMARNRGDRNRLHRKQNPMTKAVKPVRPPSATPVALST